MPRDDLVQRYRAAITSWDSTPGVRKAAAVIGTTQREYCIMHVRIHFPPLAWTGNTTANIYVDLGAAYDQALATRNA